MTSAASVTRCSRGDGYDARRAVGSMGSREWGARSDTTERLGGESVSPLALRLGGKCQCRLEKITLGP
jgi:hypothetical protein